MQLQFVQHPEDAVAFDVFGLGEGSKAPVSCEKHIGTDLNSQR